MKYINQLDYPEWFYVTKTELEDEARREHGKTTTVRSSGCGLCSAVMVADRLVVDCDFDLVDAINLSYEVGANKGVGTSMKTFGPAFAEKLGFDLEMTSDPERLCYCMRTGGAAVVHVGGDREGYTGVFSHGGHYVAAIGQQADGRIIVLDPSYKVGKYEEEGRKGKVEVKHDVIALTDAQVLADDGASRTPCFYLFWRK